MSSSRIVTVVLYPFKDCTWHSVGHTTPDGNQITSIQIVDDRVLVYQDASVKYNYPYNSCALTYRRWDDK